MFIEDTASKSHLYINKKSRFGKFITDLNRSKYLLILVLPTIIYIIVFHFLPMYGLIISLYDYNAYLGIKESKFVGLEQYRLFFSNVDFVKIITNTFLLGFYRLIFTFPTPIIFALAINELRNQKVKKLVQTVSYLPYFVSVAVIAGMTIMFLNPTSGLINNVIKMLGGKSIHFMSKPELFRPIFVITDIWQGIGWGSIIYLAAISGIDPSLYESAIIDGANKFRQIINITIPCITETIVIIFILRTGSILSISFDKAFLLQNPLIMDTADVISTYVYRTGIKQSNFSYATAAGLFNSVIAAAFVYTTNYLSRKYSENSLF